MRCFLKKSIILFDNRYYCQVDRMVIGSTLAPTLVKIFLCHTKTIWLKKCPKKFRPKYYKCFLDDTIVLFEIREHLQQFAEYMKKQHSNIIFSVEAEKNGAFPFLDIKIHTENCVSTQRKVFKF